MNRKNRLSNNLRLYQAERQKTLLEFSKELGIARSTLQPVMVDGNTTVDTLIRIADAIGTTLDDLVFGQVQPEQIDNARRLTYELELYSQLTAEKQTAFRYHLSELLTLFARDE